MPDYLRGDVWFGGLDPVRGREQAGKRPLLILSQDAFNSGPADLVIVVPITSVNKRILYHVEVLPPEAGLTKQSYIKCEDIRSVSIGRLEYRMGSLSEATLAAVEYRMRRLLKL